MFQFMRNGTPMPVYGGETRIFLINWELPDALGGPQLWVTDQGGNLIRGTDTYLSAHPIVAMEFPFSSSQLSEEHGRVWLADPEYEWRDLIGDLYAGVRLTAAVILWAGGNYSDNTMHIFTGYGYGAIPMEDRILQLDFFNELGRLDADQGRRMSPQEQKRRDQTDNSLDFVAKSVNIKWGFKEQSRINQ